MNSKMIAIIAVVAMCGAALVGVGYAYTAEYVTDENKGAADVNYITVSPGGTSTKHVELSMPINYDTRITHNIDSNSNVVDTYEYKANANSVASNMTLVVGNGGELTKNVTEVTVALSNVTFTQPIGGTISIVVKTSTDGSSYSNAEAVSGQSNTYKLSKDASNNYYVQFELVFTPSNSDYNSVSGFASLIDGAAAFTTTYKATASVAVQEEEDA